VILAGIELTRRVKCQQRRSGVATVSSILTHLEDDPCSEAQEYRRCYHSADVDLRGKFEISVALSVSGALIPIEG
jgi:hypothetical protein